MIEVRGKYTSAKIMIDDLEEESLKQIHTFLNHPSFTNPIAIMPDVHAGKGSVIGFTMPLGEKVIPNVIGVDIGCGMLATNIGPELTMSLEALNKKIRDKIPMGTSVHSSSSVWVKFEKDFPWDEANTKSRKFVRTYNEKFGTNFIAHEYTYEWFAKVCKDIESPQRRVENGVGTLGGGNHFIEVGKSTKGDYWITIHSGSRNFGKCICDYHQKIAKNILDEKRNVQLKGRIEEIKRKSKGADIQNQINQVKKDLDIDFDINIRHLESLTGQPAMNYLLDMLFAQTYAVYNRDIMLKIILNYLKSDIVEQISSTHNYIDFEDFIIRKGAITCYKDKKEIIPFNMRDGLLIVEGKSNAEWNFSGPHGSGRVLSRGNANRTLDLDEFKDQMKDVYSTSVGRSTLDEAPNAYKDSTIIELAIEPTAIIIDRVKPILNIKST